MQQAVINPASIKKFALFELGFRPFFLFASLFSVIATGLWLASFTFGWILPVSTISPMNWHGHEMVFGYSAAIVAGFLLTAVKNWTGVDTIKGLPLILLTLSWLLARSLPLFNSDLLFQLAAAFDIVFFLGLMVAIALPILKVKQWRQLMILAILGLILSADILYYLGVFHVVDSGISWGLNSAIYVIMALIFILSRRVMPFFIERGVGYQVQLKQWPMLDPIALCFLIALCIVDVFLQHALLTAIIAVILALLHSVILWGLHTKGIWKNPLLWILYLGYSMFIVGFILKAINFYGLYSYTIPLHAFTYGGIGMMTLGMMARISLGHTGRNINQPPSALKWVFALLFLGTLMRVILPIFIPSAYLHIIGTTQGLWIIAFAIFLYHYLMIFIRPRSDGKPG